MARVTEKTASPNLIAAPAIEKRIFIVRGRQVSRGGRRYVPYVFKEPDGANQPKVDEINEYFLIGTFTSVVVAASVSGLGISRSLILLGLLGIANETP